MAQMECEKLVESAVKIQELECVIAVLRGDIFFAESENKNLQKQLEKMVDPEKPETLFDLLLAWHKRYGNNFDIAKPVKPKFEFNPSAHLGMNTIPKISVRLFVTGVTE